MTTERTMTTERKRQAARANGAKSRGPVTAAGKARSSQNALKHGFNMATALNTLLPGESEDQFRAEHADLIRTLQPVNDAEAKLVENIATLQWQMTRLLHLNGDLVTLQIDAMAESLGAETIDPSPRLQIALAFQSLAETSRALPVLDRHLGHLRRQHKYLRDELTRLQSLRFEQNQDEDENEDDGMFNKKVQNEPTGEQTDSEQPLTGEPEPTSHEQPN